MPAVDITEHLKLVPFCIRRLRITVWAKRGVSTRYEDLLQVGREGLIKAAEKYEPEKGSFSTYARYWIDAYIRGYCFDQIRTVRIPRNVATKAWKAGTPLPQHSRSIDTGFTMSDGDEGVPVLDWLGHCSFQEDEQLDVDHVHAKLRQVLRSLPSRQAAVLHGRFYENRTLDDLGKEFGVSRERIRQVELEALHNLKANLRVEQ